MENIGKLKRALKRNQDKIRKELQERKMETA